MAGMPRRREQQLLQVAEVDDPQRPIPAEEPRDESPARVAQQLSDRQDQACPSIRFKEVECAKGIRSSDLTPRERFAGSLSASRRVWLGRGLLILIGTLAAVLAIAFPDTVLNLVAYAWGGMGATFGPTVILALSWRRFNLGGAIGGVVAGFVVATLWQFGLSGGPQGMFDVMPAMPGFVAGTVAAVLGTLLTAPPEEHAMREFDQAVSGSPAEVSASG